MLPGSLRWQSGARQAVDRWIGGLVGDGGVLSSSVEIRLVKYGPRDQSEGSGCHAEGVCAELELAGV